jgi:hypothetical protein
VRASSFIAVAVAVATACLHHAHYFQSCLLGSSAAVDGPTGLDRVDVAANCEERLVDDRLTPVSPSAFAPSTTRCCCFAGSWRLIVHPSRPAWQSFAAPAQSARSGAGSIQPSVQSTQRVRLSFAETLPLVPALHYWCRSGFAEKQRGTSTPTLIRRTPATKARPPVNPLRPPRQRTRTSSLYGCLPLCAPRQAAARKQ